MPATPLIPDYYRRTERHRVVYIATPGLYLIDGREFEANEPDIFVETCEDGSGYIIHSGPKFRRFYEKVSLPPAPRAVGG